MQPLEFGESELHQLVDSIWTSMVDLPVDSMPPDSLPPDYLTAFVTISGNWQGVVSIDCVPSLARRMAANLFAQPLESLDASQISDALGELANIIGGNIKSLLPGHSQLGLPVISETGATLRYPGCDVVLQATYQSLDLPFRITMRHQRDAG